MRDRGEGWPDYRAPTDELTSTLRVRDLLGMDSGIGEPPVVSSFHEGDPTADELLRSLAALPVTDPPHTTYFYNNTVYVIGGYLPALVQSASADELETVYARLMAERIYRPVGMATARITFTQSWPQSLHQRHGAADASEPLLSRGANCWEWRLASRCP